MNYSDFEVIETDEYVGTKFGKENQLEVIGWSGKSQTHKLYVVKCYQCALDPELHGDGLYRFTKGSITLGRVPCGCSKSPWWTEEQYYVKTSRKASELGFEFLGWTTTFTGHKTKIRLSCRKHGEWCTGNINHLNNGRGCPSCKAETTAKFNVDTKTIPEDKMISFFMETGAFHPETKFWKSDRKTKEGYCDYWKLFCPDCNEYAETLTKDLKNGCKSCACSPQCQKQAYINLVKDFDNIIAVKFGIAKNSNVRVSAQDSKSVFDIVNHDVYVFPTVESCKSAEKECKNSLVCGVVSKLEMPDGYTETTYLYNVEKIRSIYSKFNGISIKGDSDVTYDKLG